MNWELLAVVTLMAVLIMGLAWIWAVYLDRMAPP